jgi:prefoldin subunit 5
VAEVDIEEAISKLKQDIGKFKETEVEIDKHTQKYSATLQEIEQSPEKLA